MPAAVLAATVHHQDAIKDRSVEKQVEVAWQAAEKKLAASVPGCTFTVVSGGHDIPTLHAAAVATAIRDVQRRAAGA